MGLILSYKHGEKIYIGDDIVIEIHDGRRVKISAPRSIKISQDGRNYFKVGDVVEYEDGDAIRTAPIGKIEGDTITLSIGLRNKKVNKDTIRKVGSVVNDV